MSNYKNKMLTNWDIDNVKEEVGEKGPESHSSTFINKQLFIIIYIVRIYC